VVVLAGGFGGSRMCHGMALASAARATSGRAPLELSCVVNTGDDLELHGLHISPDLDTVMYTLAGLANDATGWGVRDETWSAASMLDRYGAETWFRLGDHDLATHLRRTELLRRGIRLTEVTAVLAEALGVTARLLPMTDDRVRTRIRSGDDWHDFQTYFVERGQRDRVDEVRHDGILDARPSADALHAVAVADLIVIAPSNPFVSIGPILALPGLLDSLRVASAPVIAVSPIVGRQAIRGPAASMFESLGGDASASGFVAHYERRYPGLVDVFVVDRRDEAEARTLAADGRPILATDTLMPSADARRRLASEILGRFGLASAPIDDQG
jgi:LPPG:FO 2-phospho-L-lactate transferase